MTCARGEAEYDLAIAMNYGYSVGSPQVLRYLTEHVELIHDPPYQDWEVCMTCGTTSGLEIALRLFCNPGDTILTERYAYAGTIVCARSQGLRLETIDMDEEGLIPADLDYKLNNWNSAKGNKPHVLYTIPTGQNPTGATQSLKRRQDIYEIAEKHDIYIFEDDPYYFIHLGSNSFDNRLSGERLRGPSDLSDLDHYLGQLPVSYLSLDKSGRVLRMDSTSKILAPGLRAGWVTASSQVIEKFISLTEVGALCPSGPTQVMLYKLLDKTWGHVGFIRWLRNLSLQYSRRRDVMVQSAMDHLPSNVCSWKLPEMGMFFWIETDLSKLGSFNKRVDKHDRWKAYLEVEQAIFHQAQDNGVLVSRGSWFTSDVTELRSVSFRMTFAAAPEEKIDRAVARFGSAVRSEFEKSRKNVVTSIRDETIPGNEPAPVPNQTEVLKEVEPLGV
ncbi:putative secondary metabolism biosynthetic enzyme [Paraconiothyrium brasiliense]|uniref:Secondary metabolism biosynthetic enzyme n=1 Tax=Paraconiothyrium brasiliense TaxID=300254 RepID=A0ABR3RG96_9PLEO